MTSPQDPHGGTVRSEALAHTFPPLPREGEEAGTSPGDPEKPGVPVMPDRAFLEAQRRTMSRESWIGRGVLALVILILLALHTAAERATTRDLLQSIDWARQHTSGLEDDVEGRLARIEAKLLAIEQRLPPAPPSATQAAPPPAAPAPAAPAPAAPAPAVP